MTKENYSRRKKKFIDRKIQGKLAIYVMINAVLYIFLLAVFLFAPLAYRMNMDESVSRELQEVATAFLALHEHFWPAIFILLIIIGIHSIRFSHRMVGPVYRFKQILNEIQMKDLSTIIRLRPGDFLLDLKDEFNSTTLALRTGVKDLKEEDANLRKAIDAMDKKLENGEVSVEEMKKSSSEIHQSEEALRALLEKYRLDKDND